MLCGANSDLFGRRYFILSGNLLVLVGAVVGATSHHMRQSIVAHVLLGFGAGNCQLATFALPELLPNSWRHIGVVIADGVAFFPVIAGPVTARISIRHGDSVSPSLIAWIDMLIKSSGAGDIGPSSFRSLSPLSHSRCSTILQLTLVASHGTKPLDIWITLECSASRLLQLWSYLELSTYNLSHQVTRRS